MHRLSREVFVDHRSPKASVVPAKDVTRTMPGDTAACLLKIVRQCGMLQCGDPTAVTGMTSVPCSCGNTCVAVSCAW